MTDTLTALDAAFLELEQLDEGALMSIGGVMVFDPLPSGGVPTVDQMCPDLVSRLGQRQVVAGQERSEKRLEPVVVLLQDRIELMVVAAGAADT